MPKFKQKLDSRRIFINTLEELNDPKNVLVTCDVGMNYTNTSKLKVFNFGITEQSSALIAAALAKAGYTVWFYSMINFVTMRPFEMVRNGIVKHNANVKVIGVKGGPAYGFLGFSHNLLWETEDQYLMEKYMQCYFPKLDKVKEVILKEAKRKGPAYIRL